MLLTRFGEMERALKACPWLSSDKLRNANAKTRAPRVKMRGRFTGKK
jgi:hypothetical protein